MSKLKNLANSLGMSVTTVEVAEMNPVIFKTRAVGSLSGLTKDGDDFYIIDAKKNTADLVTVPSVRLAATAAFTTKDPSPFGKQAVDIAENFGLINSVTFTKADVQGLSNGHIQQVIKPLGLKVSDVTISAQNEVIFKNIVLKGGRIQGLTQDDGVYYDIDVKKNTATIINPTIVSEKAKADILAGKISDYVVIAENFGLITSITLTKEVASKPIVEATESI